MANVPRVLLGLVCATCGPLATAGTADLALSVTATQESSTVTSLTLTVSNAGPDVAGADAVGTARPVIVSTSVVVDSEGRSPVTLSTVDPVGCPLEPVPIDPPPGQPSGILYVVYFDEIAPGASRSCTIRATLSVPGAAPVTLKWKAASSQDADPNIQNSIAALTLVYTPAPVPASSPVDSVLLACLLLLSRARMSPR